MRKIRVCILSVAHVHTPTYVRCLRHNPGAEIVGFYDEDAERAQAFVQEQGVKRFCDARKLLEEEKPDVALVCAQNMRHARWVEMAADAGVDVLCEKPLGVGGMDAQDMIDHCRRRGVRLMTAMCNRYIHAYREAANAVREGRIGRLVAVFASNKGTMPGGWFVQREESGGGCIIDHTVHVADLMNCLVGALPEEVWALEGHNLFSMDVEDCAVINMRYPGGVLVTLDASWSRTRHFPYGRDLTLRLVGTKGNIYVDYFSPHNEVYAPGERIYSYYAEDKDQMMIDDLIQCYQEDRPFGITGEDGRDCALVAEAAYRSLKAKAPVRL